MGRLGRDWIFSYRIKKSAKEEEKLNLHKQGVFLIYMMYVLMHVCIYVYPKLSIYSCIIEFTDFQLSMKRHFFSSYA